MMMSGPDHEPLTVLADHPSARPPEPFAGPDHPIRRLTRAVAFDERWTSDDARRLETLFDGLADGWSAEHVDDVRAAPIADALTRGDVPHDGRWLEIGSGTGAGTRVVAPEVRSLVATDISEQMLIRAPRELAPMMRSDAAALRVGDQQVDAIVLVNMLLFPREIDRVLADDGVVVWVNTLGDQTPIHLSPTDVLAALPGRWSGTTARAGTGFWVTARRGRPGQLAAASSV